MKTFLICIWVILSGVAGTFVFKLAPPFDEKHPLYVHFLDGQEYWVTYRYYWKEISNIYLFFCCFLSLSIFASQMNKQVALFFWVLSVYRFASIPLYCYNHCTWSWPFYLTTAFDVPWAMYLTYKFWPRKGMKIVK